jgi:hypothetical protein
MRCGAIRLAAADNQCAQQQPRCNSTTAAAQDHNKEFAGSWERPDRTARLVRATNIAHGAMPPTIRRKFFFEYMKECTPDPIGSFRYAGAQWTTCPLWRFCRDGQADHQ